MNVRRSYSQLRGSSDTGRWATGGRVLLVAGVALGCLAAAEGRAETPERKVEGPVAVSAFAIFSIHRVLDTAGRRLRAGDGATAETVLRQAIARGPELPALHYALAIAQAMQGEHDAAIESLRMAVEKGFRDADGLAGDRQLAVLRSKPEFTALVARLRDAAPVTTFRQITDTKPAPVREGIALVDRGNTRFDAARGVLRVEFAFDDTKAGNEVVYAGPDKWAKKLNRWYAKGLAAGNHGDLYDNRDRGHSALKRARLPQLSLVKYSDEARAVGVDYNLNSSVLFNTITIGNSSLAVTGGAFWRSLPRAALTLDPQAGRLYLQYVSNHLYVYPEHRDHDPKHGDTFPANMPYVIVSQGSSGSDRPFVEAVAAILAAFTPETKAFLRRTGLVMPTVQMIFRRGQRTVGGERDYLDGAAHPSVFRAGDINLGRMITLASRLKADEVPPMPHLAVVEETTPVFGRDYFAPGMSEALFDTPSAIARVVRSTAYAKRMVVSADETRDPNGRELSFHWTVLRGDAGRISIKPLNAAASRVEITVPWHERRQVPGRPELTTDRVDIALFVHNGKGYSAPAFISFMFPGNQARRYDTSHRIVSVDYHAAQMRARYVDPALFPERDWRDEYLYDEEGHLMGWRRVRKGETTRFTRHGARVTATDAQGRPVRAMVIRYRQQYGKDGTSRVVEQPGTQFVAYDYSGDEDRLGTARLDDGD